MKANGFTMKNKTTFLIICFLLFMGSIQAQVAVTLNVATVGTLSTLIDSTKKYQITSLTLTGELNGDDILFIREMAGNDVNGKVTSGSLSDLDLSGANIVSGGGYFYSEYGPKYYTSAFSISDYMFFGCNKLASVILPDSVTYIGMAAFYDCKGLTSVTIPGSVTLIGNHAFNGCKGLTSVNLPNGVTSIGYKAFYDCKELTSFTIPDSVTSIGDQAFEGCAGLTSITIPDSVKSIGSGAFNDCTGLTSVTIPNSVTSIGNNIFSRCTGLIQIDVDSNNAVYSSLDGVLFNKNRTLLVTYPGGIYGQFTIPNSVIDIANSAFSYCKGLTSVTIPGSVSHIASTAFSNCTGLTSVTIPKSVTSIESYAFYGCTALTSVTFPDNLISIGIGAFYSCTGLTSVTIPGSVIYIGEEAFDNCTGLTEIHCQMKIPPTITSNVFDNVNKSTCILYVIKESLQLYKQSDVWSDFTNIVEESITPINEVSLSKASVSTLDNSIIIQNAHGETISVYTPSGALLKTVKDTDDYTKIEVPENQIYLVKIANNTYKVALN